MSPAGSVVRATVEGRVGQVLLDRPESMNAITVELATGLETALHDLGTRDDVHVITIRGAGGNFCAGGDFHEVQRLRQQGDDALRGLFRAFRSALAVIDAVDVPVVALVEGNAMAGGFELLQAVDVCLARSDARLCDNHVNYGQVPGGGGSQRLPRLVGRQRALAHLLTGHRMTGTEAEALGLVQHAWPAESFEEQVAAWLDRLAGHDRTTVGRIKRLVVDGLARPLGEALDLELATVMRHIGQDVRAADYATAFTQVEEA